MDEDNGCILSSYKTFAWEADETLTDDQNWMDLVLLITRSSQLKQGGMACILVQPHSHSTMQCNNGIHNQIIVSIATNKELYKTNSSDVHAEIVAIGSAARRGRSTAQCTAYITMPPCKNCFAALVEAGIQRIVTLYPAPDHFLPLLDRYNIEMIGLNDPDQRIRVQQIVANYQSAQELVEMV